MQDDLTKIRREYQGIALTRSHIDSDPLNQFQRWLDEAHKSQCIDSTAMTLATVSANGQPDARIVLLKQVDIHGFTWFTDYRSKKGEDLAAHAQACLLFYWAELSRQVRIRGSVSQLDKTIANEYFYQRPRGSQLSAMVSVQSQAIESRSILEERVHTINQSEKRLSCPDTWGGYQLIPHYYEFWQGRINRLHDRFAFTQTDTGWDITRLQP